MVDGVKHQVTYFLCLSVCLSVCICPLPPSLCVSLSLLLCGLLGMWLQKWPFMTASNKKQVQDLISCKKQIVY